MSTGTRADVRRQQRLELIVAAAEDVLADTGLEGATLQEVGERVGMSKGALYYYVDGKDQLLALVLAEVLRAIRVDAERNLADDASALARLRSFAHAHARISAERAAGKLIVSHVDLLAASAVTAALLSEHEHHARRLADAAVTAGQLRPVSPVVGAAVLFGALNTLVRSYDPQGQRTLEELVDESFDLLLRGWLA
ncbi:MAG: TetR/AcrR family transcriptional regulator [Dehalococcoidia bacterium]